MDIDRIANPFDDREINFVGVDVNSYSSPLEYVWSGKGWHFAEVTGTESYTTRWQLFTGDPYGRDFGLNFRPRSTSMTREYVTTMDGLPFTGVAYYPDSGGYSRCENGFLHCIDGPAAYLGYRNGFPVGSTRGGTAWYLFGLHHRFDGPCAVGTPEDPKIGFAYMGIGLEFADWLDFGCLLDNDEKALIKLKYGHLPTWPVTRRNRP